jgi:hypothetical protein
MSNEIKIRINTVYGGSGAQDAQRDMDALQKKERENKLANRFIREQGMDEPTARTKARNIVNLQDEARARKAAQQEQKKQAADYQRDWSAAVKREQEEKQRASKAAAQAHAETERKAREEEARTKAASEAATKKTQQTGALHDYDQDLRAAELRTSGKRKEAEVLEKETFLRRHSLDLQQRLGVSEKEALTPRSADTM